MRKKSPKSSVKRSEKRPAIKDLKVKNVGGVKGGAVSNMGNQGFQGPATSQKI